MALTLRETISARILTLIDALDGVTALRPKRVHWIDQVTADLTAIVRQGELRFIGEDADGATGTLICQQDYAITLAIVPSDSATVTCETEINRVLAAIVEALAADIDLAGAADYEGLAFGSIAPESADEVVAETLNITVTFVTGRTNMTVNRR